MIAEGEETEQGNVLTALPKLWEKRCKHTVILGEGGMGKTVSLIRLWNEYLEKSCEETPVPVFIALNEYNQISDSSKREDFIVSIIKKNYGDQMVSHEAVCEIMKEPIQEEDGFIPSLILLLDGFNEITLDKRELLIEMRHLIEQAKGVQIVITSRYDVRGNFNWTEFHLLKLMELEDKQVNLYLQEQGTPVAVSFTEGDSNRLRQLIKNPMMLTLYASTCEVQKDHLLDRNCDFKKQVESPGELLWNFLEAQVARLPERLGDDPGKQWFYKFLLKFLLPAFGYEMEKAGQFEFNKNELNEIIQKYCIRFSEEDFFLAFAEYELHIDDLDVGECPGDKEKIQRRAKIVKIVYEELLMMVNEGHSFLFLHQNFRDFFAAVHLLNEAEISVSKGEIPVVFKERILDYFVRRLLGEIEGEHLSKPYLVKDEGWKIDINKDNWLHQVLDLCRGKVGEEVGFVVWNIVTIWKEVRGELTGADLSRLNLSGVQFNGVICSHVYGEKYLSAVFDGSRVHEKNLFPKGHTWELRSALYSPDGKKILSTSGDRTIKEWDAGTGECLKTFAGHTDYVNRAVYSPDGKKILSASSDKTIKEWNAETGQCVKTLVGHMGKVSSAVYSPDGKKILTASHDKTIKEWDAGTGQCVKTLTGHTWYVNSAVYSFDGQKILSASDDKTFKEWDATTGECLKTLPGESAGLTGAMYSPDGKKILSASYYNTIKEWDADTGVCLKTITGHTEWVTCAVYSPDGKKILSASADRTIKEWDTASGVCVKTLVGHEGIFYSAVYSPDGKKILSASEDCTIKEWEVVSGICVKILAGYINHVYKAVYSPDGKKILSISWDKTISEWDVGTGKCVKTLVGHMCEVNSAVYSPDGKKILTASDDKTIKEWNAKTVELMKTLVGHMRKVSSAVYSPDGQKILSTSWDHNIKEWDAGTVECLNTLVGHTYIVNHAKYSTDGQKILSASSDHTIKEWDVATGECLKTLAGQSPILISASYSPDGKKILSALANQTIKEWDAATGQCVRTINGHTGTVINAVYSLDGKKILSASDHGIIKEWDVVSGVCVSTIVGTKRWLNSAVYSPDSERILSASNDGTIKEWNIATGQCERELINVPGLFIQGCSFQNLEKGSLWTEEGLKILKQYNARL